MPISPEMIAAVAAPTAALVAAAGVYVGKRLDSKTQVTVNQTEQKSHGADLAVQVLENELGRKSVEVAAQDEKIDAQGREIAELRVANWLVLQHLLDVHRHFAEGNPPPPPPIPDELLQYLRES